MPRERLNGSPVKKLRCTDIVGEYARNKSAEQTAQANVNAHNAIPAPEARKLDLIRPDQTGTLHVDQLAIEDVLLQQHFLRPAPERLQIKPHDTKTHSTVRDLRDSICRNEHLPLRNGRKHTGYRRIPILTQPDDQIIDPPQLLARAIDQIAPDD
jgi:hypothetical protein